MIKLSPKVTTVLPFVLLTLLVIALSASAVWKNHEDKIATVDTTRQAVVQRNQAVQALANQEAVNKTQTANLTTLTAADNATKTKLANLCALTYNKTNVNCK